MYNKQATSFKTLGIETSCDETGVAVYDSHNGLLGTALFSQIDLHKLYGGVVPEIASRSQLEQIGPVIHKVLLQTNLTFDAIDVVAVTNRPGLAGSLLVGLTFAKTIAWTHKKKLIGVNHLEGHIFSSFLEHCVPFPHICLTASGGHTALYYVTDFGAYTLIAQTRDDAAGEAFDKIAKLMNLGYPGGPIIEAYAKKGDFKDYFEYPRAGTDMTDFSFSGLKTAVLYDLIKKNAFDKETKKFLKSDAEVFISQVASSFLVCLADIFIHKINMALQLYPNVQAITFVGGCACNKYLQARITQYAESKGCLFFTPLPKYCTDNGAMIALVGSYKAAQKHFSNFDLDINQE